MRAARAPVEEDEFAMAQEAFAQLIEFLRSPHSRALSHTELEAALSERGRELLRVLFQAQVGLGGAVVGARRRQRLHRQLRRLGGE